MRLPKFIGIIMKIPMYAGFLLFVVATAVSAQTASSLQELAAARSRYQTALAAAGKPVHERYLNDLQQMKSRALLAKNLDMAVAIDAEIKIIRSVLDPEGAFEASLIGSRWLWWREQVTVFQHGGKATWSYDKSKLISWKVTNAAARKIEGVNGMGDSFSLTFDPDLQHGTLIEKSGKEREIRRLPDK